MADFDAVHWLAVRRRGRWWRGRSKRLLRAHPERPGGREKPHELPPLCGTSGQFAVIAVVDDDRNILTSVSIALEAEGYRVMTYSDGASALDGFNTSPPDLAILDIK